MSTNRESDNPAGITETMGMRERIERLAARVQPVQVDERTQLFAADNQDWQRLVDCLTECEVADAVDAADRNPHLAETIGHAIVAACWRIEGRY
jgi:hypothetical protein